MNAKLFRTGSVAVALAAVLAAAGCASDRASPRPEQITRASASVDAAANVGAYEHGGVELTLARQKLSAARQALASGHDAAAERLAVEADLDAQLALAKSRSYEMQSAVAELHESIRTLQQELRRSEAESLGRLTSDASLSFALE